LVEKRDGWLSGVSLIFKITFFLIIKYKQMKKVLFLVCLAIMGAVVASNAQNGGQLNENPSVKMEFVSVVSNITTIKITNKQNCSAEIQTKTGSDISIKSYAPLSADTVKFVGLTGTNVKIQSKALTNCGVADFGQVELTLNINSLPVKFGRIKTTLLTSKRIK